MTQDPSGNFPSPNPNSVGRRFGPGQARCSLPVFFPSLPPAPLQTLGKNEEQHTDQEAFSLHCVFQLDLNRRPAPPLSLTCTAPPLFLSSPLCGFVVGFCFVFLSFSFSLTTVSSNPGKGSYMKTREISVLCFEANMTAAGPYRSVVATGPGKG